MSNLFPSLTSTSADELLILKYQLRQNAVGNFNSFIQAQNDWIRFIWYNEAFDAQTICDSLSSAAVDYFNLTTGLRQFVVAGLSANGNPYNYTVLYPLSAFSLSGDHVTIFNEPYVGP